MMVDEFKNHQSAIIDHQSKNRFLWSRGSVRFTMLVGRYNLNRSNTNERNF
jgi:hypothetical protein